MSFNRDGAAESGAQSPEYLAAEVQRWMQELSRVNAKIQSGLAALADIADSRAKLDDHPKAWDLEYKSLGNEVAGRVHLSGVTVTNMMIRAQSLVADLPNTFAALEAGDIRVEHANVISQESRILYTVNHLPTGPTVATGHSDSVDGTAAELEQRRLAALVSQELTQGEPGLLAEQQEIADQEHAAIQAKIIAQLINSYETAVLPHAYSKSPNQLRTIAKRVANQLTGATLDQRHEAAHEKRCVFVEPLDDGMAKLSAIMEASIAYGIHDRLTKQAKLILASNRTASRQATSATAISTVTTATAATAATASSQDFDFDAIAASDPRNTNQLRADLLADILLTGAPTGHCTGGLGAVSAQVQITMPMLGLLNPEQRHRVRANNPALQHIAGIDGNPTLAGYGPINQQVARALIGQTPGVDRIFVDPIRGSVLETDRYTPNADLKRFLTARDVQCRFIGCGVKAARSETDHTIPFSQGGRTSSTNMQFLCKSHHNLKHHSWQARLDPDGKFTLTSPQGVEYAQIPMSEIMNRPPPSHPGPLSSGSTGATHDDSRPPF